jgi:predicted  nucleic acid-binding Zn-ribbon protein
MVGFSIFIAIVAALLAAVFWFQSQSAAGAVKGLRAEADAARKEAEDLRAQVRDAQAESKARSQQMLDLREKLNDARKRTQQSPQKQRSAREAELEEDLAHARRLLEEAHAAEQNARKDAASAIGEAGHLRAELERAQARSREVVAAPPPPAPAQAPVDDTRLRESEAKRAETERRARELDIALKEAREKERSAREEVRKARGRAETNNRVYLVTKGELEVIRERFALAEKALWKAGLPVPTMQHKERPLAKGPAAVPAPGGTKDAPSSQAGAEQTVGEEASSRPEPTPAEPPSGGAEPISAAAAQMPSSEAPRLRNGPEGEAEPSGRSA